MAINNVTLMGNITNDIELKQTPSGKSVASFTVAVNRKYKNEDGTTSTNFINCVAWRKTAEFVAQYFKKGKAIALVGEIQTRSYTDNQGNKRYVTEVVVNEVSFAGGKDDSNSGNTYAPEAPSYASTDIAPKFEAVSDEDDLPF